MAIICIIPRWTIFDWTFTSSANRSRSEKLTEIQVEIKQAEINSYEILNEENYYEWGYKALATKYK